MTARLDRWHFWLFVVLLAIAPIPLWFGGVLQPAVELTLWVPMVVMLFQGTGKGVVADASDGTQALAGLLVLGGIAVVYGAGQIIRIEFATLLVVGLLGLRLITRRGLRHDPQILALTFIVFAAGTLLEKGVVFGILFVVFAAVSTNLLAIYHLRVEDEKLNGGLRLNHGQRRLYFFAMVGINLFIVLGAAVFFVVVPRVGAGFLEGIEREQQSMRGFSDSVSLGTHGTDRANPEIAMRVEFPDGRPSQFRTLHWRVAAFRYFSGDSWSRFEPSRAASPDKLGQSSNALSSAQTVRARVYLEPLESGFVPTIGTEYSLDLESSPASDIRDRNRSLKIDDNDNLVAPGVGKQSLSYVLEWPKETQSDKHVGKPLVEWKRQSYLQTSSSLERVEKLARQITRGADSTSDKAKAVRRYLENNYSYKLDPSPENAPSGLEDFLFDSKQGHCEYFATAGVVLLREAGVPARLVNGFLGGRWNASGDYLVVRQGDAHSWLEYYSPKGGWEVLDPTPEDGVSPRIPGRWTTALKDAYDSLRFAWFKWVVEYDLSRQFELWTALSNGLPVDWLGSEPAGGQSGHSETHADESGGEGYSLWYALLGWLAIVVIGSIRAPTRENPVVRGIIVTGGALVLSAVVALVGSASLPTALFAGAGWSIAHLAGFLIHDQLTAFREPLLAREFRKLEKLGVSRGMSRKPGEGPGAFVERFADQFPKVSNLLSQFREIYLEERFGPDLDPDASRRKRIGQIVERIAEKLKQS